MWRKRAGSIKKGIFAGIILLSGILFFPIGGRAVCVHYETAKTALYTESYHRIAMDFVQGSPLEAETEDGVDPSNGKLTLLREDLHMQGMAGMDFSLTRYYDSKKANIGKAIAEEKKDFEMDTVRIAFPVSGNKKHEIVVNTAIYKKHANALKDMFVSYEKSGDGKYTTEAETQQTKLISGNPYNVYGISTGWAFDFPWIETKTIGSDTDEIPTYLHYGSLGTMRIATDNKNAITGFENYAYQDIKLEDFNQTTDGVACRYLLRDKRGLRTYFNSDGVVVMQKDNHDNTIRFTYRNKIYFDTITDSVGRKVKFSYKESQHGLLLLQNVKVEGQKVAGGVSKKTITYNSSETSYRSIRGDQLYGSRLNSAVVEGTKETYTYQTVESLVNTAGAGVASQRAMTNESYLIQGAEEEGCIRRYEYRAGAIRSASSDANQERDVVTQHYYVTREYDQSSKNAKKKANGFKYDYFQRQTDRKNNTKLVSYGDLDDEKHEMQAYGTDKLQCMTLVSTYNPNKKQKAKKFADYVYTKEDINISTLELKKKPKKSTMVYVYHTNRLPLEVTTEGKKKTKTEYSYDRDGAGSLIMYKTLKNYGTKRTGNPQTTKEGYTYDSYRNVLTSREPKAFKKKYKGKEKFFTTIYTYHGNGYPAADKGYVLNQKKTIETYENENTKCKEEYKILENGVDVNKSIESISENGKEYQVIKLWENKFDAKGNLIENKFYPNYRTEGVGSVIQYDYHYNKLGQLGKKEITRISVKHPQQNEHYTEQATEYDFFGNIVSITARNGLVSVYSHDEENGQIISQVEAKDSIYESQDRSVHTEDNLKSMSLDTYNRCTIDFYDDFGNVTISKDEKAGTWTESEYDYGSTAESTEEIEDEENDTDEGIRLLEERIYAFDPTEPKIVIKKDGTKEYNYDIGGRSNEILSGTRYTYNADNEEIIVAEFSGGSMDAKHCSRWVMSKEEEIVGEDGITTTISYEKNLSPQYYKEKVDEDTYYNLFDAHMLDETITRSVTDDEGNLVSETITKYAGNEKEVSETKYCYDIFGNVEQQTQTVQLTQKEEAKNKSEVVTSYQYDYQGNITQTVVKSRKDVDEAWVTTTTKAEYDDQGQLIARYDPEGVKDGYATRYEYDLSGQQIKESIPIEKKDGTIIYQTNTKEYDEDGNVTAQEIEQDDNTVKRTEYKYDLLGQLVQVKDVLGDNNAIYAQYLYDLEGNKIRQYTGLTSPLSVALKDGTGDNRYTYMGKEYHVEIDEKEKGNTYSETKYHYDKRNQLISYTDPEGNSEKYSYDMYGNLIKTVDKNGNIIKGKYDYQNRLEKEEAIEKETEETTRHKYVYDDRGNACKIDDHTFSYSMISGEIISETWDIGRKTLKKYYEYDSDGVTTGFGVKVGGQTELSYNYEYDGESKLKKVVQTDANRSETIATYEYDANGVLINEKGQKVNSDYKYNLNGRVCQLTNKTSEGILLSKYDAFYEKDGQKTKEIEEVRSKSGVMEKKTSQYRYDSLGRLTKESHAGAEDIFYTYDSNNNRKEMKTASRTVSYQYNKNDELQRCNILNHKTGKVSVTLYKNDRNGNQLATVKRRKIDHTNSFMPFELNVTLGANQLNDNVVNHYNAFNQQKEIITKNYKIGYTYNEEGLRMSKTVNGKKRHYIWDGDRLVMELDEKGDIVKRYIQGQNLIYSDSGKGSSRRYFVYDIHGSVVQLLNDDNSVVKQYSYDVFGNEEKKEKADDNFFRYCGEYYDKETDTIYLRARNYDTELGRFLTRDTYMGEDESISSLNLYIYCNNDAVNQVDPTGHWGRTDGFGVWEYGKRNPDRYVHKSITMEALGISNFYIMQKKVMDNMLRLQLLLLEASVLPDYTQAKKPWKYEFRHIKEYARYRNGKICGYNMLGKKGKDTFHGKCRKYLHDLRNRAINEFGRARMNVDENYIFLGCVLHAIQDYPAHSYISELKAYKDKLKRDKGYKASKEEKDMVTAYHEDWNYKMVETKKRENGKVKMKGVVKYNKKIHKRNKDNPYKDIVYNDGKWDWVTVNYHKNNRYIDAVNSSKHYIRRAAKVLK